MKFEEKLKALRINRGMSQENLADAVHVSRSAIAKYENGNGKPSQETLHLIAQYFDIDPHELEDDLIIEKKAKNEKIVLFTSTICGGLLVILSVFIVVLYNKAKFLTSGLNLYASFVRVIFIFLIILGVILVCTFIISLVKHNCRKSHLAIFLSSISFSLVICLSGYFVINSQYKQYAEFTIEKWANAINNHDYRGLMYYSFIDKYNIIGFTTDEVEELLGKPDGISVDFGQTSLTLNEEKRYVYDLGFYDDYIDPTTFEIAFNSNNLVVRWDKIHH